MMTRDFELDAPAAYAPTQMDDHGATMEVGMRVLVMGSGGVGGYMGGMLAKGGNDATFTARGAHLEAMQSKGLQVIDRGDSWMCASCSRVPRKVPQKVSATSRSM